MSKTTPGLRRLRAHPAAESIRETTVSDQKRARREARARIEAENSLRHAAKTPADPVDIPNVLGAPPQTPADAPAHVAAPDARPNAKRQPAARPAKARPRFRRGVAVPPSAVPVPLETMPGMSRANSALYLSAAAGVMPTPPDFSKPSYACDRKRLQALIDLADQGDANALRAFAIKTYYSAALELDRFRHRAIIALEARARQAA